MKKKIFTIILFLFLLVFSRSQDYEKVITISGKVQTDILLPQNDFTVNSEATNSKLLSNTYGDLNLLSKYADAGIRFEMYEKPLPGFEAEYEGAGVPFFYVKGKYNKLQFTLGNFYEQFGSGLIFRTYEDRSLGLDNSLRGALLTFNNGGIQIKGLFGYQRNYWKYSQSSVKGIDAEIYLDEWIDQLKKHKTRIIIGTSFVSKYQQSELIMASLSEKLNLPEHVGAIASRLRFQKNKLSLMTEFAVKANDPSAENNFIYKNGQALLLSGSYSQKGLGLIFQIKRSDNMSFKSQRSERGRTLNINHLPAFCKQHAFALANLYPYATQANGEWAINSDLIYKIKKGTVLGGKTGMDVNANFSRVNSIQRNFINNTNSPVIGTYGYTSDFFAIGNELYYQDFNVLISKNLNKYITINAMYMNQLYNQEILQGHAKNGSIVHSNILVLEGKYKLNKKNSLRSELQYLKTRQDDGNWMFGLLEFTVLPSFIFTVSDMFNSGITKIHYYMISTSYSKNAHRLQLSFGRTRAGFNCSGGVCRYTPASKGFQVSYLMSF